MLRHRWLIGAAALGALAGWIGARSYFAAPSLEQRDRAVRSALESIADDDAAREALRRLSTSDEAGLAGVVATLDSSRSALAEAARQALLDELARCQSLEASAAAGRRQALAAALDRHVERFTSPARRVAGDLAAQLLRSALAHRGTPADQLAETCESILRRARLSEVPRLARAASSTAGVPGREASPPAQLAERALAELEALPGGGLQAEPAVAPLVVSPAGRPNRPQLPPFDGGASRPENPPPPRPAVPDIPDELGPVPAKPLRARPGGDDTLSPAATPARATRMSANEPARRRSDEPARKDLLQLAATGPSGEAAQEQLREQGWSDRDLELGRRYAAADAAARARLAGEIPRMAGIDARAWLLRLADDESADVRWAALTALGTSGDADTLAEVERRIQRDDDRRIQALGKTLLNLRK